MVDVSCEAMVNAMNVCAKKLCMVNMREEEDMYGECVLRSYGECYECE